MSERVYLLIRRVGEAIWMHSLMLGLLLNTSSFVSYTALALLMKLNVYLNN